MSRSAWELEIDTERFQDEENNDFGEEDEIKQQNTRKCSRKRDPPKMYLTHAVS